MSALERSEVEQRQLRFVKLRHWRALLYQHAAALAAHDLVALANLDGRIHRSAAIR